MPVHPLANFHTTRQSHDLSCSFSFIFSSLLVLFGVGVWSIGSLLFCREDACFFISYCISVELFGLQFGVHLALPTRTS